MIKGGKNSVRSGSSVCAQTHSAVFCLGPWAQYAAHSVGPQLVLVLTSPPTSPSTLNNGAALLVPSHPLSALKFSWKSGRTRWHPLLFILFCGHSPSTCSVWNGVNKAHRGDSVGKIKYIYFYTYINFRIIINFLPNFVSSSLKETLLTTMEHCDVSL